MLEAYSRIPQRLRLGPRFVGIKSGTDFGFRLGCKVQVLDLGVEVGFTARQASRLSAATLQMTTGVVLIEGVGGLAFSAH